MRGIAQLRCLPPPQSSSTESTSPPLPLSFAGEQVLLAEHGGGGVGDSGMKAVGVMVVVSAVEVLEEARPSPARGALRRGHTHAPGGAERNFKDLFVKIITDCFYLFTVVLNLIIRFLPTTMCYGTRTSSRSSFLKHFN
jgi:hypothetical protein